MLVTMQMVYFERSALEQSEAQLNIGLMQCLEAGWNMLTECCRRILTAASQARAESSRHVVKSARA